MTSRAPEITIIVRHSAGCKYVGDEQARRCQCRKHFRWSSGGKKYRQTAGTRSWREAEAARDALAAQLAGRSAAGVEQTVSEAVELFIQDKRVQGLSPGALAKYTIELPRLILFCEKHRVFHVKQIDRKLLTQYAATWEGNYKASQTRALVRSRTRAFLRYCYEAQWLDRIPALPKITVDAEPTMPLSAEEFDKLLDGLVVCSARTKGKTSPTQMTPRAQQQTRALILLMRWSGLAIGDAVILKRANLKHDKTRNVYVIATKREKTGVDVLVPIPGYVAKELEALPNSNPDYFFWTGNGNHQTCARHFSNRYMRAAFEEAKLVCGHMVSHRLRDTFAVDLLEKGVPLEDVSKLLGHRSIKVTEKHYAKWVKGRQDRLINLVTETWSV